MKARDIMNQPVVAATRSTTARDVAIQMLMGGYSGMPITEGEGKIVGLVTELDLIRALRASMPLDTTTAQDIMTSEVTLRASDQPAYSAEAHLERPGQDGRLLPYRSGRPRPPGRPARLGALPPIAYLKSSKDILYPRDGINRHVAYSAGE